MAGGGRKQFTAGDVLTAGQVQDYLQDQAVMVFAGTAARSSAIPSPTDGMVTYNQTTDALELYNGTSWISMSGVHSFASSAARTTAMPTPTDGMVSVLQDTDQMQYYNGSSWLTGLPFGAWTSYTPTLTAWTVGTGSTFTSQYTQIGKTVIWSMKYAAGTGATFVGNPTFSLPVTAATSTNYFNGTPAIFLCASTFYAGWAWNGSTTAVSINVGNAAGTYLTATTISATIPAAWAVGATVSFQMIYQAA